MEQQPKQADRQVAFKVRIQDLLTGRYVKEDGWLPNYVVVGDLNVSRANLIGVIVSKDDEGMVLDDGSSSISLRFFDKSPDAKVGQVVNVIGRPREFGTERYIVPEIVRPIADTKWVELRKLELAQQKWPEPEPQSPALPQTPASTPETVSTSEPKTAEETVGAPATPQSTSKPADNNPVTKVYNTIKEQDNGQGVGFDDILVKTGLEDLDAPIKKLLEQGDIFEIKPGQYKVLE